MADEKNNADKLREYAAEYAGRDFYYEFDLEAADNILSLCLENKNSYDFTDTETEMLRRICNMLMDKEAELEQPCDEHTACLKRLADCLDVISYITGDMNDKASFAYYASAYGRFASVPDTKNALPFKYLKAAESAFSELDDDISAEYGNVVLSAEIAEGIGFIYAYDRFEDSYDYYQKALFIRHKLYEYEPTEDSLYALAYIYNALKHISNALERYDETLYYLKQLLETEDRAVDDDELEMITDAADELEEEFRRLRKREFAYDEALICISKLETAAEFRSLVPMAPEEVKSGEKFDNVFNLAADLVYLSYIYSSRMINDKSLVYCRSASALLWDFLDSAIRPFSYLGRVRSPGVLFRYSLDLFAEALLGIYRAAGNSCLAEFYKADFLWKELIAVGSDVPCYDREGSLYMGLERIDLSSFDEKQLGSLKQFFVRTGACALKNAEYLLYIDCVGKVKDINRVVMFKTSDPKDRFEYLDSLIVYIEVLNSKPSVKVNYTNNDSAKKLMKKISFNKDEAEKLISELCVRFPGDSRLSEASKRLSRF